MVWLWASSFRLDDAPDFEVFYAVTDEPIDVERIVEAAAAGAPAREIAVPEAQTQFLLRKEP